MFIKKLTSKFINIYVKWWNILIHEYINMLYYINNQFSVAENTAPIIMILRRRIQMLNCGNVEYRHQILLMYLKINIWFNILFYNYKFVGNTLLLLVFNFPLFFEHVPVAQKMLIF